MSKKLEPGRIKRALANDHVERSLTSALTKYVLNETLVLSARERALNKRAVEREIGRRVKLSLIDSLANLAVSAKPAESAEFPEKQPDISAVFNGAGKRIYYSLASAITGECIRARRPVDEDVARKLAVAAMIAFAREINDKSARDGSDIRAALVA